MSLSDKIYNCEVRIELKNQKDPRISGTLKLAGTYNRETMTMLGHFKFEPGDDE